MILPPHDSVAVGRLSGRRHAGHQLSPAPAARADALDTSATVQERSDTAASVASAAARQHPAHALTPPPRPPLAVTLTTPVVTCGNPW